MLIKDREGNVLIELDQTITLDETKLQRANFSNLELGVYDFSDADLREADFTGTELYWTYFYRANCEGAIFRNARFCGVVLDLGNFQFADLRDAYVSFDNLNSGCSLLGADFSSANLEGADFRGSKYDRATRFPTGFDPQANGMLFVEQ